MSRNEKIVLIASAAIAASLPTIAFIKAIKTRKHAVKVEENWNDYDLANPMN